MFVLMTSLSFPAFLLRFSSKRYPVIAKNIGTANDSAYSIKEAADAIYTLLTSPVWIATTINAKNSLI